MKATVIELWNTYREIISFDGSEIERQQQLGFEKMRKCYYRDKICRCVTEVMIDDRIYLVMPVKLQHPSGGVNVRLRNYLI